MKCEMCRTGHSEMCENVGGYTNRLGQTPGEARRIAALRDPDAVYAAIHAAN